MFQNISRDYEEIQKENYTKENKIKRMLKNSNIYLLIISLLISTVGIGTELAPFGLAMLTAVLSNNIPIGLMYILVGIGTTIGFGMGSLLQYILITAVFFLSVIIKKPKMERAGNEKNRLGLHLFFSCFIVQIIGLLFKELYIYDILYSLMFCITVTAFYKIFANAITVINDYNYKKVFSIEEVVGALLLIAIAISSVRDLAIFGFSIKNILSILLVLILGWKNGILVGATGGITVGIVLGIIGFEGPVMVAAYGLAGMFAGIFRKLGKIGVGIGFILGTIILSYVESGNTVPTILIKEILIAFIGLLAVPNNIKINIEDLNKETKYLPVSRDRELEGNSETIYRLNNISDTISEMARSYNEAAATIVDEEELLIQEHENMKIFIRELMNGLEGMEDNVLFDDLYGTDNELTNEIFNRLLQKGRIQKEDIIEIFEQNNRYLIGYEIGESDENINNDIQEVVKIINSSYRLSKINFIWKKRLDENKKVTSSQLQEVSNVISNMADNLENKNNKVNELSQEIKVLLEQKQVLVKDINLKKSQSGKYTVELYTKCCENVDNKSCNLKIIQKVVEKVLGQRLDLQKQVCGLRQNTDMCVYSFTSKDNYSMQVGVASAVKATSTISGDSVTNTRLTDGKYLLALSDGMGSGEEAKKSSGLAISMLEKMLSSGFEKENSIKLINSILSTNTSEEMYATLDVSIIDLFEGTLEFIKNGACPTYIKNKNRVETLKAIALPTGIVPDMELIVYEKDLEDGDIIVMCSDGILESNNDYTNKELWVQYLLEEIQTDDAQKIADIILSEAKDNDYGREKDDMTVIVAKIKKNK